MNFAHAHEIEFNWRSDGKIYLHETEKDLAAAKLFAEFQRTNGGTHTVITKEECLEREDALIGTKRKIAGGTYLSDAAVGDCKLFCKNLADLLTVKFDGKIIYDVTAEKNVVKKRWRCWHRNLSGHIGSESIYRLCWAGKQ